MQTFTVNANDIENRLDPNPYQPKRLNALTKIRSSKYKVLPLKDVVEFKRKLTTTYLENQVYIGLENIESNTGRYIQSDVSKESFGSAFVFQKGHVLFPKLRPYLNKVFFADFDGICSTEFHVLQAIECNPLYLFAFLNSKIIVDQTSCLMTGNTLPRLQTEDIEELLIPVPPLTVQQQVASIIEESYQQKNKKEQEAYTLVNSINTFIQQKIGIEKQETKYNMCFVVQKDDLNGIFSPNFYISKPTEQDTLLEISEVAEINPYRKKPYITQTQKVPYVGLPETDNKTVNDVLLRDYAEVKGRNIIEKDDILFARIEPSVFNQKYIYVNDLKGYDYAFTSTEFYILKGKSEKINQKYLFYILFIDLVFSQIKGKTTGSTGRRRLDKQAFAQVKIPVPSLETQAEIVNEIEIRLSKVKKLQQEAIDLLNNAKSTVEEVILESH